MKKMNDWQKNAIIVLLALNLIVALYFFFFVKNESMRKNEEKTRRVTTFTVTVTRTVKQPPVRKTDDDVPSAIPTASPSPSVSPVSKNFKYGIVTAAITPVRRFPRHNSERVTEAVMGEEFEILHSSGKWLKIKLSSQKNYPGWAPAGAVIRGVLRNKQVKAAGVSMPSAVAFKILKPGVHRKKTVFLGSVFEVADDSRKDWVMVKMPGGSPAWLFKDCVRIDAGTRFRADSADVVKTASSLARTRYLWGGMSANGIDCSGLVHMAYRANGIEIHRDADLQYVKDGERIEALSDLQPGDLVFFKNRRGEIYHVGIYLEKGGFLHSSKSTDGVGVSSLYESYYSRRFAGGRRVIK